MRVGLAVDHSAYQMKDPLVRELLAASHEVVDFGRRQNHWTTITLNTLNIPFPSHGRSPMAPWDEGSCYAITRSVLA